MTKYCHGVTLRCWWALWSCEKFHWCDCRTNNSDQPVCFSRTQVGIFYWYDFDWYENHRLQWWTCRESSPQSAASLRFTASASSHRRPAPTVLTHTQHLQLWFHLQPAANFSKKVLNFLCTLTFTAPKIKQTQLPPAFEHSGAFSSSTDRNVPQEKVQRAEWEHMLDFCSPHGQKHDF